MSVTAIVLAAGQGTRMKSRHPKVVHEMLGTPLVEWVVSAALEAGASRAVVVVGNGAQEVRDLFAGDDRIVFAEQTERLGTGHAARIGLEAAVAADPAITSAGNQVLVTYGDTPLLRPETLASLVAPVSAGTCACALLSMELDDPFGYGRVVCEGASQVVSAIVEEKDCTPEQRLVRECNAGAYCFDAAALAAHVGELGCANAQGEYYLTDMVTVLSAAGLATCAVRAEDPTEALGVNSRSQLADATRVMQARINGRLMDEGVTMLDPALVWIGPGVTVGRDTQILPLTFLMGDTHVGEECTLGPNTRLTNTRVGDRCRVEETVSQDVVLENDVECGPRAFLRPGTHLLDHSKAGTHVEIKNSTIGEGSKVPHLSYIGDTTMGAGVNVGAGSITCNYDGVHKNKTSIGDNAFIGSDTMMVAPVAIGAGALVGAGSTITKDVPADALGLERSQQKIVEGYAKTRRERQLREGHE